MEALPGGSPAVNALGISPAHGLLAAAGELAGRVWARTLHVAANGGTVFMLLQQIRPRAR
jgi:hypothetical protein